MKKILILSLLPFTLLGQPSQSIQLMSVVGNIGNAGFVDVTNIINQMVNQAGTNIYYVSPTGNDSNTGTSNSPVATVWQAAQLAQGFGAFIRMLPGTNWNELANPRRIKIANGVNFDGTGAVLVQTNFAGAITGGVLFRPISNNKIFNFSQVFKDANNATAGPIGYFGAAGGGSDTGDMTNVIYYNYFCQSDSQGPHFEKNNAGNAIDVIFYNPTVFAADVCWQVKQLTNNSTVDNDSILVYNDTSRQTNFTGVTHNNNKSYAVYTIGDGGRFVVNGGTASYGDDTVTNSLLVRNEFGSGGFMLMNKLVDQPKSTNNPSTADFGDSSELGELNNVVHRDQSPLTYFNGTIVFPLTSTNTLVIAASGATNSTGATYLVSITAGTSMAMKDGSGTQFLTPILSSAYVFKPGWRLTGTLITGTASILSTP